MPPPDRPPVAELAEVRVTIGDQPILDNISLTLPAGSTTVVIGASGSGKSTLLKLLIGLRTVTGGRIYRDGMLLADPDWRAIRQKTGYALQEIGLLPHLSAGENIALPMRLADYAEARREQRLAELASRLRLTAAQLARYPAQLSGGQQQRVGLCRALALQPDLLLLDEAYSGLDAITRADALASFAELREQESLTTLLVTHDLREARALADWLVILDQGRIVRQGPRDAVFDDPQHPYARQLIGKFV